MFRLTLNFAGRPIRKFNFDQESVCIGRDPECEILIDNIGISRKHATIECANGEYILTDLKSHNGTFVRGQRIYHHQLSEADEFFIGKYSLHFENLDVSSASPAAEAEDPNGTPGMAEMTFKLDKSEIEKIMGALTTANAPKIALIAPKSEQMTLRLDACYYLIGKHDEAAIRLRGFLMPDVVAALIKDESWFHVLSLSRRHPVKVNGQKVMDHQLADGDMFEIGKRKFRFALA